MNKHYVKFALNKTKLIIDNSIADNHLKSSQLLELLNTAQDTDYVVQELYANLAKINQLQGIRCTLADFIEMKIEDAPPELAGALQEVLDNLEEGNAEIEPEQVIH